jgi:hypothetical protein
MQISRRDFLRKTVAVAVAVPAAGVLGGGFFERILRIFAPKPLTDVQRREMIIAKALGTAEGRAALRKAMAEPIKTSLMYQGIGRKLLMIDELPQGALPRYERDISVKSYVIPKRGGLA